MSVQHINDKKQVASILQAGKITVIDFSADWCGPCKALAPKFEKVANDQNHQAVNFIKVNIDEAKELARKYNIQSIPTLIYFDKTGTAIKKTFGLVQEKDINTIIEDIKRK